MAGTKADLRSMSCWASSPIRISTCSMCTLSDECMCAFCSHTNPVVALVAPSGGERAEKAPLRALVHPKPGSLQAMIVVSLTNDLNELCSPTTCP